MKHEHHHHEIQSSTLPEPVTGAALQLRARMSHKRWERIVRDALEKVRIVGEIETERQRSGDSRRKCHGRVAPEVILQSITNCSIQNWKRSILKQITGS